MSIEYYKANVKTLKVKPILYWGYKIVI